MSEELPLELEQYIAFPEPNHPPLTRLPKWLSSHEVEELILNYVTANPSPDNKVMAFDLITEMKKL